MTKCFQNWSVTGTPVSLCNVSVLYPVKLLLSVMLISDNGVIPKSPWLVLHTVPWLKHVNVHFPLSQTAENLEGCLCEWES